MRLYSFRNPGWSIHDTPEGRVAWATWTLRGGLYGETDSWDEARALIADAGRRLWPFAEVE